MRRSEPTRCAITGSEQVQQIASLLDHLVGDGEQGRWNFETKSVGDGQIEAEFKFGRLLDRKAARLGPAQNLVGIVGSAAKQVGVVCSIRHETAPIGENCD